jgi:membrane protein
METKTSEKARYRRSPWTIVRRAIAGFIAHDVLTLAAALSFYTLLSFAPLMVMVLWATTSLGSATRDAFLAQLAALAGDDARLAAIAILDSVSKREHVGSIASAVGVVVVLIGATSVFAQLQATLNTIWDIPPRKVSAIRGWLRRRIISAGVLLAIGFVLIVSTVVSSMLSMVLSSTGPVWDIANELLAMAIFSGLLI